MRLSEEAERQFQAFLADWLVTERKRKPTPRQVLLARAMWIGGVLSKLPQRELIALEVTHAEITARRCGAVTDPVNP